MLRNQWNQISYKTLQISEQMKSKYTIINNPSKFFFRDLLGNIFLEGEILCLKISQNLKMTVLKVTKFYCITSSAAWLFTQQKCKHVTVATRNIFSGCFPPKMSPRVLKGLEASGRQAAAEAGGWARERVSARWRRTWGGHRRQCKVPPHAQWKLPQQRAKHGIIANVDQQGERKSCQSQFIRFPERVSILILRLRRRVSESTPPNDAIFRRADAERERRTTSS
jgi:hypothetical protein